MQPIDHFDLFGSPIRITMLAGLDEANAAAVALLVDEARRTPGIARSNEGGWHSVPDLTLRREGPWPMLMRRLADEVDATVKGLAHARGVARQFDHGYGIQAWAMVLGEGDWVTPHDHAESHFSGAYYLDAGDALSDGSSDEPRDEPRGGTAQSGRITFLRPQSGGAMIPGLDLFPSHFTVPPRTGMLIIFPGSLPHYVHPYRGTRPRVCLSFNVRVQPRPPR